MTLKEFSVAVTSMGLRGHTEKTSKKKKKKKSSKKDHHDEETSKAQSSKAKLATRHLQAKRDKKKTKQDKKKKLSSSSKSDKETDSILEHREKFDVTATEDVDSILQHREKFDASTTGGDVDSILQHREQFGTTSRGNSNTIQQQKPPQDPDWFDQESLAMDLESLRRKPWYKQNSETPLYADQRFVVEQPTKVAQKVAEPDWDDIISQKTNQIEVRLSDDDDDEDDWDNSNSDDSTDSGTDSEGSIIDSAKSKGTMDTIDEGYERGMTYQEQVDRFYNGAPASKEHQELLEYAMQSVARLERIEELRESRAGYKKAKAERKQQRKERRALRRQEEEEARHAAEARNQMLVPSEPAYAPVMGSPRMPVLIDLIDVCERKNTLVCGEVQPTKELQSLTVQRWKSSFKEEIPVIVDLTDYGHPQQILDLTNLSEPPVDVSVPRARGGVDGCCSNRNSSSNRRLDNLRREREEKLHRMTKNIQKVAKKDPRENTLTSYQKLMKGVAKGLKRSVCGS